MKNYSELRMKGRVRDLIISKKMEIIYSHDNARDERKIYWLRDQQGDDIHIRVDQRIGVNDFVNDTDPVSISSSAGHTDVTNDRLIYLTLRPLKELILYMLNLKEVHDHEIQAHYVDIISRYLQAELNSHGFDVSGRLNKHQTMAKLRDYIDRNIKRNLSVKNLINVCHMSERSLYYLFRKYESTTPLAYVQQRKIIHLHRELSAQPSSCSITEVAMGYGFSNLGRFSQLYRQQIGELPSETRSRALVRTFACMSDRASAPYRMHKYCR